MFLCVWVGKFYKNWYYRIPLNFGVSLGQAKSVSITEMLKAAVSLKGILFLKKIKKQLNSTNSEVKGERNSGIKLSRNFLLHTLKSYFNVLFLKMILQLGIYEGVSHVPLIVYICHR